MVSLTVFIMSKTHTEKDRERERERERERVLEGTKVGMLRS